jgi:hypothetical protein
MTTTTTPALAAMLAHVEEAASEADRRERWLVVADWFDDHDDPRGEAVRWMVREGKQPYKAEPQGSWPETWRNFLWEWNKNECNGKRSLLPEDIHEQLDNFGAPTHEVGEEFVKTSWKAYRTRLDAEVALLDAYVAAKKEGWQP